MDSPKNRKALYDGLTQRKLYTKSFEEFEKKYSTPEQIQKLYEGLKERKLFTKELTDFESKYFADKKKVDTIPPIGSVPPGYPQNLQEPQDELLKNIQRTAKLNTLPQEGIGETVPVKIDDVQSEAIEGLRRAAPDLLADLEKQKDPLYVKGSVERFPEAQRQKMLRDAIDFIEKNPESKVDPIEALAKSFQSGVEDQLPKEYYLQKLRMSNGTLGDVFNKRSDLNQTFDAIKEFVPETNRDEYAKWNNKLSSKDRTTLSEDEKAAKFLTEKFGSEKYNEIKQRFESALEKERLGFLSEASREEREAGFKTQGIVNDVSEINGANDLLNFAGNMIGQSLFRVPISLATGPAGSIMSESANTYDRQLQLIADDRGMTKEQVIKKGLDKPAAGQALAVLSGSLDALSALNIVSVFRKAASGEIKKSASRKFLETFVKQGVPEGATEAIQGEFTELGAAQGARTDYQFDPVRALTGFLGGLIPGTALGYTTANANTGEGQPLSSQVEQPADNTTATEPSVATDGQEKPTDSGVSEQANQTAVNATVQPDTGTATSGEVVEPIQQDGGKPEGQTNQTAVQQDSDTTQQGKSEESSTVLDTENKEGFTEVSVLNKINTDLKSKYGDKKAKKIQDAAYRLVNPNKNTIAEIRSNGVVVKEGDKFLLKPFTDTDLNVKKWKLANKSIDVTEQFINQTNAQTSSIQEVKTEKIQKDVSRQKSEAPKAKTSTVTDPEIAAINDVDEVATRYYDEARIPSIASGKELAIANVLLETGGINQSSFVTNQDISSIGKNIAKSYFKKDRPGADQVAERAQEQFNGEVTPEDVVNFIIRFPKGAKTLFAPSGNPVLKDLSDRYVELTGKGINIRFASDRVKKFTKPKLDQIEQNNLTQILEAYNEGSEDLASEADALYKAFESAPDFIKDVYGLTDEDFETIKQKLNEQRQRKRPESQVQQDDGETDRDSARLREDGWQEGEKGYPEEWDEPAREAALKAQAQRTLEFDGRTERQQQTASRRIGKVALDKLVSQLKKSFPNFKVVSDLESFKKAYQDFVNDGILKQIIGEKGARALDLNDIVEGREAMAVRDQNRLIAEEMYAKGKDDETVWYATGWVKGKDGLMRYEIDYGDFVNVDLIAKEIVSLPEGDVKYIGKLKDIFKAKDLYIAHPELAEVDVLLSSNPTIRYDANYDPNARQITINAGKITRTMGEGAATVGGIKAKTNGLRGLRRVFSHEIQHGVQRLEGFRSGGTPGLFHVRLIADPPKTRSFQKETLKDYVRRLNNKQITFNQIPSIYIDLVNQFRDRPNLIDVAFDQSLTAYEKYERLYGEIEARNAQARADMDKFKRTIYSPIKTENKYDRVFLQQPPDNLPNGFVYRDTVYINPDNVRADTAIHEFAHIWLELAKANNKALYKTGIALVKNTSYHNQIKENPSYQNLGEDAILDEALVTAIGERGALLDNQSAWKKFFRDLFSYIKHFLGVKTTLDVGTMKLDDFLNVAAKELLTPGEISFLSDVRLPETASFKLKNFKTEADAFKAYKEQELIRSLVANDPEHWKMSVDTGYKKIFNAFMEGIQDQNRRIKEIQNSITDFYIKKAENAINNNPSLSKADKKKQIATLKSSRSIAMRALMPIAKDPHSLLDIMTGKIQFQLNQLRDKYFGKPSGESGYGTILESLTQKTSLTGKLQFDENSIGFKLKEKGLSLLDVGFYAYVKHAPIRNAKVNERRVAAGEEPLKAASGMTDEQAAFFLGEVQKSGKQADLEQALKEIRRDLVIKPLNMKLEAGIINQETYDRMIDFYEDTYVPLNVEEMMIGGNDAPIGKVNKGVFGTGIKGIKGTDSFDYTTRVNPFIQLIYNYEKTIADIERNKAIKGLADLIEQFPDERIWKVKSPKYDIQVDENGEFKYARRFPDDEIENYGVPFYVDGKQKYVVLLDERLREMFNRTYARPNEFVTLMTSMSRAAFSYLRLAFTGLNPSFTFPNLIRDIQDALVNLSEYNVKSIRRSVLKGIGPSMRAVWNFERDGTIKNDFGQAYLEMKKSGGDIAWLDYNSAEQFYSNTRKEINKFFESKDGVAERTKNLGLLPIREALRHTLLANKSAEMAVRLSTYKTLRDAGADVETAALAAKNVTVNFNKKGTFNPILSQLYLFLNAGVQGTTRLLTSLATSKESRAIVTAGVIASVGARFLLDAMDDDKEEDKKRSNFLTQKDFAENLIFASPFDDKDVVKIPVSYNMRPFKAMGDGFYDVYVGRQTVSEAVVNVMGNFISSVAPIIESGGAPTLAQPFIELGINKRLYNDVPISPQKDFSLRKKDSERFFGKPSSLAMLISQALAGADANRDDVLEISPNSIDYVFDWTLGGLKSWYKTGDNLIQAGQVSTDGIENEVDLNKIAVVQRLYAELDKQDWRDEVNYYDTYEKVKSEKVSEDTFKKMLYFQQRALKNGLISQNTVSRNLSNAIRIQRDFFNQDFTETVTKFLDGKDK